MKNKTGRPSDYRPEYCQRLIDFFSIEPYVEIEKKIIDRNGNATTIMVEKASDFPTLAAFACEIGVHRDTLQEWSKNHPEFSVAIKRAKELQERFITINGMKGLTHPAFTIFAAKNLLKWTDRQTVQTEDEKPIEISFNPKAIKRKD